MFSFLDNQTTPSNTPPTSAGSSSVDDDDDDDNHVYPGVIAAGLLVFLIAVIGIIIVVMKKKKSIRQSQPTARVTVTTPPQAPVVHYTYPSVSSQAPVSSQPHSNPVSAQQQISQAFYPHYHGAEHAAAVGSISNQSHLPGNQPAGKPPTYSACTGERVPDESTNNRPMFLPPDYASAVSTSASVQVSPATNS